MIQHTQGMGDAPRDGLRRLIDTVLAALDEGLDGRMLAGRAYLSRFHFDRLISAGLGEAPAGFRRRLLLERAAWQLGQGMSVTEAGIAAGYGSPEAFARSFGRAFGVPPSRFAGAERDFRLLGANGIHFHPPLGLRLSTSGTRSHQMDLTDRLLEHDRWLVGRLLERAGELTGDQLDHQIRPGHQVLHFDGEEPTVRLMLDRLVWTKEVWTAAIAGRELPAKGDRGLAALTSRFAVAGEEFCRLARGIRDRGEWDDVFIDALCEPPQSFTFGGAIAHVVTYSAYRRQVLMDALTELGVADIEAGCPIEWERTRATQHPHPPGKLRGTQQ